MKSACECPPILDVLLQYGKRSGYAKALLKHVLGYVVAVGSGGFAKAARKLGKMDDLCSALLNQYLIDEDAVMQQLALKVCALNVNTQDAGNIGPLVKKYMDTFVKLTDDKRFRGELTNITMASGELTQGELDSGKHAGCNRKIVPHPNDLELVLPVLVRLFF